MAAPSTGAHLQQLICAQIRICTVLSNYALLLAPPQDFLEPIFKNWFHEVLQCWAQSFGFFRLGISATWIIWKFPVSSCKVGHFRSLWHITVPVRVHWCKWWLLVQYCNSNFLIRSGPVTSRATINPSSVFISATFSHSAPLDRNGKEGTWHNGKLRKTP